MTARSAPTYVRLCAGPAIPALAAPLRCIHSVDLDRYPDGVLYVDLDDLRRDGVVEVADAVGDLLISLGITLEWLERSLAGRSKQYWTRTRNKQLIVVVDNARYGSEAVPLLPASAGSLVIITSQGAL